MSPAKKTISAFAALAAVNEFIGLKPTATSTITTRKYYINQNLSNMKFDIAFNNLFLAPVYELGVSGAAAAVPTSPIDMRRSTRQISNSFVSETSSNNTYIPKLVLFVFWILGNHQELINPDVLPQMIDLDNTDKSNYEVRMARRTASSRPVINQRTNLRNFVKSCIENTPPCDGEAQTHNSPIKIDGEGSITHRIIKEYTQTSMKEVWVGRDAAEEYIKAAQINQSVTDEMVNSDGQVKCSIYQSPSQYSGIRSSISYLYKLARVPQPEELSREMSTFISGMERTITCAKHKLGLKITEGKKPLSMKAYSMMARRLFENEAKEDIFAHLFLVLDWCLMKRAENCTNAKINHILFRDDCLVFEFAKSKGHQKGEEHVGPWHVYANPETPWICPA